MTGESFVDEKSGGLRWRLGVALAIAGVVFVVEIVGVVLSGSLVLFADAGHVLSDIFGLIIAFVAATIARRPATDRHTFGFARAEVLGALANGLILVGAAVFVLTESVSRWLSPTGTQLEAGPMLIAALIGLAGNAAALLVLRPSAARSINARGAYLEVLGDTFGSIAAIAAATIVATTGFTGADTLASLVIVAIMIPRAFSLLRDVFRVLSSSAPISTDVATIRQVLTDGEGVVDVHDIHVWSITSGQHIFSAHVVVEPRVFREDRAGVLLDHLCARLRDDFDVGHSTFQLEPVEHAQHEPPQHR